MSLAWQRIRVACACMDLHPTVRYTFALRVIYCERIAQLTNCTMRSMCQGDINFSIYKYPLPHGLF